jgi:hypothetical protein
MIANGFMNGIVNRSQEQKQINRSESGFLFLAERVELGEVLTDNFPDEVDYISLFLS